MANIDVGKVLGKRETNRDLPLVPFIDFLLCLISFLLITAVWSQNARLETTAQVPGVTSVKPDEMPRRLHVDVRERKFELSWKQGETVLARYAVDRRAVPGPDGEPTYPDLARTILREWQNVGSHKAATDSKRDQAVLHSSNTLEFGELAAVIDAIHAPRREQRVGARSVDVPAFTVSFAVN